MARGAAKKQTEAAAADALRIQTFVKAVESRKQAIDATARLLPAGSAPLKLGTADLMKRADAIAAATNKAEAAAIFSATGVLNSQFVMSCLIIIITNVNFIKI